MCSCTFAAYYKRKQGVNIWGFNADYEAHQPWRQNSRSVVFSVTKGRTKHSLMKYFCIYFDIKHTHHLDYSKYCYHHHDEQVII